MTVGNETTGTAPATGGAQTTPVAPIPNLVWQLPGIRLAELNDMAALQTRRDRKYLLPLTELTSFLTQLVQLSGLVLGDAVSGDAVRVLEIKGTRSFGYQSVYFDTPSLQAYFDAARGRPRRCKIRTRTYIDSGICSLEVKTRDGRDQTVKQRLPYPLAHQSNLTPEAHSFVGGIEGVTLDHRALIPVLTTRYRRSTLLIASSLGNPSNSRLTIDTDLGWVTPDGRQTELSGYALLETKTLGKPSEADRLLWARYTRPLKISKYCTGLAALNPSLAANKWNRLLRTHFDWTPDVTHPTTRAHPG